MNDNAGRSVSQLLERVDDAKRASLTQIFPQIYEELRMIAGRYMADQSQNHTLQPTALVNEAFLKIRGSGTPMQGHEHVLALAAVAMRSILVDHARSRLTLKRNAGARPLALQPMEDFEPGASAQALSVLELNDLIQRLVELDPRRAKVVEFRFFGGMTNQEIATVLDVARSTVADDWVVARAWLRVQVQGRADSLEAP